jgi:succinate dehydrogenase / fumarate reductase flavoprotein subunit
MPEIAADQVEAEARDLVVPFERTSGESPYDLHSALQDTMGRNVGIYRTQSDLERGLAELEGLWKRWQNLRVEGSRMYNPGWHLVRDLRNLLAVSEAITKSAILRKESRGAHSRLDYAGVDESLGRVNMCAKRQPDGSMSVTPTPLPEMPAELRALFDAKPEPAKAGTR